MRRDDLDLNEFALLPEGRYKGHIWGVEKHLSNPKGDTGERFDMYLITVRVDKTESGSDLIRPRRLYLDTWPTRAAGIKRDFVAGDKTLSDFDIPDDEKAKWKDPMSILGRPCFVQLGHERYTRKTGEDDEKHLIKKIEPDFMGEILTEEDMEGIDSIERISEENRNGDRHNEEMPTADDPLPF